MVKMGQAISLGAWASCVANWEISFLGNCYQLSISQKGKEGSPPDADTLLHISTIFE
jgi:hypothetical protein